MGLEPTTFCMANASRRSRPFAQKRWVSSKSARTSERDRTRANAEPCHSCHVVRREPAARRASLPPAHTPFPTGRRRLRRDAREADVLLDRHAVVQRSIRLRNPYVDPMNAIEVEFFAAQRACDEAAAQPLLR
jgi:hypothetical protein